MPSILPKSGTEIHPIFIFARCRETLFITIKTTGYAGGQSLSVIMLKKVPFDLE